MTDTRSWIGFWLLGFWVRVLWLKLSSIECLSIHNSTILTLNYDHYHIIHHFCYLWRRRRSIFFLHYNISSHGFQFALSITVIQKKVGKIILIFRTQSSVLTIITVYSFLCTGNSLLVTAFPSSSTGLALKYKITHFVFSIFTYLGTFEYPWTVLLK